MYKAHLEEKTLAYQYMGAKTMTVNSVSKPTITAAKDATVKTTLYTIHRSDLHMYKFINISNNALLSNPNGILWYQTRAS